MKQTELEKILLDKIPNGPFRSDGTLDGAILAIDGNHGWDWPNDRAVQQLNRAYQIGRWVGRTEEQEQPPSPPVTSDDLYQPICKFCDQKVDEMVTVHFKSGDQRMCVECMHKGPNRK